MHDSLIPVEELVRLFNTLPDVVFFVKNGAGRYTHVNLTLVRRLGLTHEGDVIGHHPTELFPDILGARFAAQDQRVLAGESLEDHLEVHFFPRRVPGWCVTCKYPLRQNDQVTGLIGISRDVGRLDERHPVYDHLLGVLDHLKANYAENVHVETLAKIAGVSVAQLERHFQRVFQLNPMQMLTKLRIDAAMQMLRGTGTIASIGLACGYGDQSAFARKFRKLSGLTPGQYRALRG